MVRGGIKMLADSVKYLARIEVTEVGSNKYMTLSLMQVQSTMHWKDEAR